LISWGVSSTAALLDGETGEQIATLTELNRSAENIAFGPNGRIAAALGRQRVVDKNELARVRIYDHDGTPVRTLEGHTKGVLNLAFSPDGSRLATCGRDGTVRLWDATSGELQRTLTGLPDTYNEVAWSPDGERIVAGSFRAHVGLWDATNGTEPDGSMLAQAGAFRDGKLRIWSRDGAELASLTAVVVDELAWSADGSLVAAIARNGMVTVWDGVSAEPALIAPMAGAMAWAPEGARLAIPREGDHAVLIYEGTRLVASLPGHTDTVHSLAWSADGRRLLSASKDKSARVWDIALALAPVSELATLVAERTRLQVDVLTVTPLGGVVEDE
jgi:WD40 repeat protein